jgi:hypothetical protein
MPVCFAQRFPIYRPAMRIVSAITNAYPALITTTFAHDYVDGAIVRLIIPERYGMQQANQLQGAILIVSPTSFYIDINTTLFDPFSQPINARQCAQVVPIGEIAETLKSATVNVLPFPAI